MPTTTLPKFPLAFVCGEEADWAVDANGDLLSEAEVDGLNVMDDRLTRAIAALEALADHVLDTNYKERFSFSEWADKLRKLADKARDIAGEE